MSEKLNEKWLSAAELAKKADVPESTTRRYLTRFESFFKVEERSRGRRYHPDSVAVVARIQALYSAGAESEEIDRILSDEFPMMMPIDREDEPPPPPPVAPFATKDDIQQLFFVLESLREEMQKTREENSRLLLRIEGQERPENDKLEMKVKHLEQQLANKEMELFELQNRSFWEKLKFWKGR